MEEVISKVKTGIINFVDNTTNPEIEDSMARAFETLVHTLKIATNSLSLDTKMIITKAFDGLLPIEVINHFIEYLSLDINDYDVMITKRIANTNMQDLILAYMLPISQYLNDDQTNKLMQEIFKDKLK